MTNRNFDVLAGRIDLGQPIAPLDVATLLRGLWAGKWIILLTTLCAIFLAGYYAFVSARPAYSATATLKIEFSERLNSNQAFLEISPTVLSTEAAVLRSRHLLEQVIVAQGLENDPEFNRYLSPIPAWSLTGVRNHLRAMLTRQTEPSVDPQVIRDKTIENLAKTLTTGPERGTYLLAVTATTSSPQKSRVIANAVADAYLADQVLARTTATEAAVNRLSTRVLQLQTDLQDKETAINALLSAGQMPDETLFDTLSRQAVEVDQRLAEAHRSRAQSPALISGTDRQITALEEFRDRLTEQIAAQSAGLVALQQLRREAQSTRALYTSLLAELQQTQVSRGIDMPTARILSPATQGQYVAPRKTYILAIAALLGASIGITIALVRGRNYIQRDRISDHSDCPVIGQFPVRILQKPALRMLADQPLGPLANAATQLRTQIISGKTTTKQQVIVATSCRASDARAQVTIALAHAFVRLGRSVLVIDADMHGRDISKLCPPSSGVPVNDVIAGRATLLEAAYRHPVFGINVICATQPVKDPADLFSSAGFSALLDQARSQYDHIILVAPPVLVGSGALILAQCADFTFLTVRASKSRTRDFSQAQTQLQATGTAPDGVVMVTG